MFIVHISPYTGSEDFTLITPRYWNTLSLSHLQGENASQLYAVVVIHTVPIFVLHVPITARWTTTVWIHNLPKAFTHNQGCENRAPDPLNTGPTPQPLGHAFHEMLDTQNYLDNAHPHEQINA